VESWDRYLDLRGATEETPQEYDSVAYLGAATSLLISSEALRALLDGQPGALLGALSDLHPYIARRLGAGSGGELPELPELSIPGEFRRLFRDWADNKVDFVAQESSEGVAV
jgi:hypothetical protein